MSNWEWSEPEWEALAHLRFGTSEAEVFRDVTIILMTVAG